MKAARIVAFAAALAASGPAGAQGVGLRPGTTGPGGDVSWGIAPTLSARIGYSRLDLSGMLDWSPAGLFRLTAGVVGTTHATGAGGAPLGLSYTLNGMTYRANNLGSLPGAVDPANQLAPYLGIGYGKLAGAGVNFHFDLGVVFPGSAGASLNATCGVSLSASQCAQLQSDLAAERYGLQQSPGKFYPIGQVGVSVGF